MRGAQERTNLYHYSFAVFISIQFCYYFILLHLLAWKRLVSPICLFSLKDSHFHNTQGLKSQWRYFWFGDLGLQGFDLGRGLYLYVWETIGKKIGLIDCEYRCFCLLTLFHLSKTRACHVHESSVKDNNKANIGVQSIIGVIVYDANCAFK